ncbi:MAG: hypothetical protein IPQ07_08460 [Myxococcales bacterium]|nr:hypothetical protein [Myxococcales bacterium]
MSQVACIGCNLMIDVARADVTGRGYRCNACSMKASMAADGGRNDVTDHLTVDERKQRAASAGTEMVVGGLVAATGLLVFLTVSGLFGMIAACAGLGMTSHGYLTRREMTGERTS